MNHHRLIALTLRTVLDADGAADAYGLHGLAPASVIKAVQSIHRRETGGAAPPPVWQRIAVAVAVIVDAEQATEHVLGLADNTTERTLLAAIADWLNDDTLTLIGWHTPVSLLSTLCCRALRYADDGLTLGRWATISDAKSMARPGPHRDLAAAFGRHHTTTPHTLARALGLPVDAPLSADHIHAAWQRGDRQALVNDARIEAACLLAIYRRCALIVQDAAPFNTSLLRYEQAALGRVNP